MIGFVVYHYNGQDAAYAKANSYCAVGHFASRVDAWGAHHVAYYRTDGHGGPALAGPTIVPAASIDRVEVVTG